MKQWHADIATGFARHPELSPAEAVQLAKRAIRAEEDDRQRAIQRAVEAARVRWNVRQRQRRFLDYVTANEANGWVRKGAQR
jgi:hypothetical protein